MRKRILKKLLPLLLIAALFSGLCISVSASSVKSSGIPNDTYVYWGEQIKPYSAQPVYRFQKVLDATDIGCSYTSLTDIAVDQGDLYILDSESSSVMILDEKYHLKSSFTTSGQETDFAGAQGIESRGGKIYICDTSHERVLVFDRNGALLSAIYLPKSDLIPDDFLFRPIKIGVDSSGYIYVLSDGSYYGAILYAPNGDFLGFYGSNTVKTGIMTALETIWENLTMTNEKRANSERKLPYQFSDLFVDSFDFVYTATGRTTTTEVEKGQIKRLNPGGINVLNSDNVVFSDRKKANVRFRTAGWTVDANISSVAVDSEGYIFCVDRESSKIFVFDANCHYVSVMGGGNGDADQVSALKKISGIGILDDHLIVLDEKKNNIVILEKTEYGKKLMAAQTMVLNGDYSESLPLWQDVLAADKNNQLAYSGTAKAYLANQDYEKALFYAKEGKDYETYDNAKTYIRNQFLKDHFNLIAVCLILLVGLISAGVIFVKRKGLVANVPVSVKNAFTVFSSPVDTFKSIKEKQTGSVLTATVLMMIFYLSAVVKNEWSDFQFIGASADGFNSVLTLLKTIGAVLLFTVSNWAVATLLQGRGTLKEIYMVTCYSLSPLILSNFLYVILSHSISLSESAFIGILSTFLMIYAGLIFVFGLMTVHDLTFGRFLGITLLSLFGILVVVFIGVIVFMLAQQLYTFVLTLITEIKYR